jgi:integrase
MAENRIAEKELTWEDMDARAFGQMFRLFDPGNANATLTGHGRIGTTEELAKSSLLDILRKSAFKYDDSDVEFKLLIPEAVDIKPAERSGITELATGAIIDSLIASKKHKRAKHSTLQTYEKRLRQFEKQHPILPSDANTLLDYLEQFDGETGRHRRNHQDLLAMLYQHACRRFGLQENPMLQLERTMVSTRPIRTLTLEQVRASLSACRDPRDLAAIELLVGHGWRQVEVRRVKARDVRAISNGLIEVDGKERRELTPILGSTAKKLIQLAAGLQPEEYVFRAHQARLGERAPLGEDGMLKLIKRIMAAAGIADVAGHDLRRTFATLATEAGADHFLVMRLLRDIIPGVGNRYILFPRDKLVAALERYSPLTQTMTQPHASGSPRPRSEAGETQGSTSKKEKVPQAGEKTNLVEAGESRTPRPREAARDLLQA